MLASLLHFGRWNDDGGADWRIGRSTNMNIRFPIPFLSLQVAVAPLGESVCELPIDRLPDPVIALENRRLNELVPELEPSILKPRLLGDGGSHHFDLVLGTEEEPTQ